MNESTNYQIKATAVLNLSFMAVDGEDALEKANEWISFEYGNLCHIAEYEITGEQQ